MERLQNEILGLGFSLGHDTGAAIVSNIRGILIAANEERFSRKKQEKHFPINSIQYCIEELNIEECDIDFIAYSNYCTDDFYTLVKHTHDLEPHQLKAKNKFENNYNRVVFNRNFTRYDKLSTDFIYSQLRNIFSKEFIKFTSVLRVDHHDAHIASAYYCSGFDSEEKTLLVSSDGFGDNISCKMCLVQNDTSKTLQIFDLEDSVGLVYQFVTGALGYTMLLHEGKITGLSARGDSSETYKLFENLYVLELCDNHELRHKLNGIHKCIKCDSDEYSLLVAKDELKDESQEEILEMQSHPISQFSIFNILKKKVFKICEDYIEKHGIEKAREDLAAGVQKFAEQRMLRRIKKQLRHIEEEVNICLSGGLFANVTLNQKIANLDKVKDIFIFPNMGDGGLAPGAAYEILSRTVNTKINKLEHVFFGYEITKKEILDAIECSNNVQELCTVTEDRAYTIADLVSKGYIVANVVGKMEYGPRALCHRSIHFNCNDSKASVWLNKQLDRTETMPFAPVLLEKSAKKCFKDYNENNAHAAEFMTISFKATKYFKDNCPGAVHVDNTVRAQIVKEHEEHKDIVSALRHYKKITGKPAFINTSYNRHGEPIVMTAYQAIYRFLESNIHYLVIGDYVIEHPSIKKLPIFKGE